MHLILNAFTSLNNLVANAYRAQPRHSLKAMFCSFYQFGRRNHDVHELWKMVL